MKHFILLVTFATLLYTCRKDTEDCPPDLPCATQVGANTFGCYINGKPWVAGIAHYLLDPTLHEITVSYDEPDYGLDHNNIFQFSASRVDSFSYEFISMAFSPVLSSGNINHNILELFRIEMVLDAGQDTYQDYQIDTLSPYEIHITNIDLEKNIASGKFAFSAISSDFEDSIVVTNGRFDLRYDPY